METQSVGLIGTNSFKSTLTFFISPAVSLFCTNSADEILVLDAEKHIW